MNKTKIDWCDYTINPIKGICQQGCRYCYARRMYARFHWDPTIRLTLQELRKAGNIKTPSRIFVCSTHDLFGEWIPSLWISSILQELQAYPQHQYLLLTKNPRRLDQWVFPNNNWLGTTITKQADDWRAASHAVSIHSGIKFLSIEPLLGDITIPGLPLIDWIIVGAMTGPGNKKQAPKAEWIEHILAQAWEFHIPVFMKENLRPYWDGELKREFPQIERTKP